MLKGLKKRHEGPFLLPFLPPRTTEVKLFVNISSCIEDQRQRSRVKKKECKKKKKIRKKAKTQSFREARMQRTRETGMEKGYVDGNSAAGWGQGWPHTGDISAGSLSG